MEDIKNDYGEVTREQLRALGAAMSEATDIISKTIVDLMEKLKEFIDKVAEKVTEIRKELNNKLLKEQKTNMKQARVKIILKRYSPKKHIQKNKAIR